MVPFRFQDKTSSLPVSPKTISDSNEMRKFFKKIEAAFRKKNNKINDAEKGEKDNTTDAAILPQTSGIRNPKNNSTEEHLHENPPADDLVLKEDPVTTLPGQHHGIKDRNTITSPHVTKIPPKHQHREWSVSDAASMCAKLSELPKEKQKEITAKVNKTVLAQPEYFYDFCMVSSEEDYDEAKALKDKISKNFHLRGCTIYEDDFFTLGRDSFEAYERMMDRSTKIFFYISSSLNENEFCRRLQSASVFQGLMSKVRKEKEKCVPVFPNGLCRVPLALSGIGGLEIPSVGLTAQRLRITYTEEVRRQRTLQEQDRWKRYFIKTLHEEVEKYLQEDKCKVSENESTSSDSDDEDDYKEGAKNFTPTAPKAPKTPPPMGMLNGMQELLQNATSAPVVTSSEVNIDSTTAHIGHNITIHLHCNQSHNEVVDSDSSDSSD